MRYLISVLALFSTLNTLGAQTTCDKMGISNGWMLHMEESEVNQITQACSQTGVKYFRTDFAWSDVQWNGSDSWEWSNIDRVLTATNQSGMETIAILDYFPPWADASTDTTFWYNFVYQAGLRYIPQGVKIWEMWNEPNITNFWPSPNVEDYVNQILKPGSNAIRAAAASLNEEVIVLTAGLAPAATDGTNISQIDFVTGIYEHGAKDYFDGLGQHPYCWPLDPSIENPYNWFLKTQDLRNVMIANEDQDKLIWGTEMGWPTHNNINTGINQAQQADFLTKAYNLWQSWSWTGPLIWYAYNDAGDDLDDPEDNFGLVDENFNPKPALDSFLILVNNCILNTSTANSFIREHLEIYPSPTSENLNISGLQYGDSIKLVNALGQISKTFPYKSEQPLIIDITDLKPGLYFVLATDKTGLQVNIGKVIFSH